MFKFLPRTAGASAVTVTRTRDPGRDMVAAAVSESSHESLAAACPGTAAVAAGSDGRGPHAMMTEPDSH